MNDKPFPAQHQNSQPGIEEKMYPRPKYDNPNYQGSEKLKDKIALITGGDSGIGRAVATSFAKEGAHISIVYQNEHDDAKETAKRVKEYGSECLLISGDIRNPDFCKESVEKTNGTFGHLDILVNNAATQNICESIEDISVAQLENVFKTNIFSYFYFAKYSVKFLKPGSSIINTTSVTAYRGSDHLIDYASTKAAIVGFTRSLAKSLLSQKIRVNAIAPGPVWTPLIPSSFAADEVESFGADAPMGRAAQPYEIAPAFVYLASEDASYMTGQVLHPNGGEIINS